jgi:protein SCO1/2
MNRRELFNQFGGVAACTPGSTVCGADLVPNVALTTHENRQVKFYDDLVKGKQIVVNMMYANCEGFCSTITSRLVDIHAALGERVGKDLFMYSITLKPEEDDAAVLKDFAAMHHAVLPGWEFLTGDPYDIETLRYALFRHNHIKLDLDPDVHAADLRIINDAYHCWLHVAPLASTATVLQHINWANPPRSLEQRLEDNRRLQESIDEEVEEFGYRKIV